jgi:hypothetical protein
LTGSASGKLACQGSGASRRQKKSPNSRFMHFYFKKASLEGGFLQKTPELIV